MAGPCTNFQVSPGGRDIVFGVFEGTFALHQVPILGGVDPVRISGPMAGLGVLNNGSAFSFTPRGERVVYLADQEAPGIEELYASFLPRNIAPTEAPVREATRTP